MTHHSSLVTGLYVHVPFCHARCRYCDFATYTDRAADAERYLAALRREMGAHRGASLDTVFVGGGTPSALDPVQWGGLMAAVREHFTLLPGAEVTVECNPESVTPDLLAAYRATGVNRLSLGLQASQDRLLRGLGRLHDFDRFLRAWADARAAGFDNLNLDLMYGLPGQTREDWRETLRRVLDLRPEHLSAYALKVEHGSAYGRQGLEVDDDLEADLYEEAVGLLAAAGYRHYEISNFALPGRECRHNLRYWHNASTIGVGLSAAGFDGRHRRVNAKAMDDYLAAVEGGRSPVAEESTLTPEERVGEDLMLALRLADGVRPDETARRLYGPVLDRFTALGFLTRHPDGRLTPTLKGWLLSNRLFQELLSPAVPA
jgi:oxygen-independent coproporphyrinogen-3 oxidase